MKNIQLSEYSDDEIMDKLYHGNNDELKTLAISVAEYHPNYLFAQDLCFFLLDNENEEIRGNALLGLSFIARRFKQLDVDTLISLLRKHRFTSSKKKSRAEDAFEDISLFTGVEIDKSDFA